MKINEIFIVLAIFITIISSTLLLGSEFNNLGKMDDEDISIYNKLSSNYNSNIGNSITNSTSKLEIMRNRLQQENKENSFAFQFSQALVWTYDLLSVVNSITHISSTLAIFIGISNIAILTFFALLDFVINFILGFAIWRGIFK